MGTRSAILAIAAATLAATTASAAQRSICYYPPADMQRQPNVDYHVFYVNQTVMWDVCEMGWSPEQYPLWGCAVDEDNGVWHIYIEQMLDDANRACVLEHEKAHLPPNLWVHENALTADNALSVPLPPPAQFPEQPWHAEMMAYLYPTPK